MAQSLIGALRVTLGIDSAEFTRGMDRAQRKASTGSNAIQKSLAGIGRAVAGLAAGFSAFTAARAFLDIADKAKSLDAQLKLATATFGSFNQAQVDARRIAESTRSGLEETAKLYGNFVRATEQIGGTQAEASRATETFSKALKIGGADANAAASATLQFGQALASGVLRGDEFNSIAEASPRILRLLADAMGIPQGKLRELAAEGQLTSDVLFRALTDRRFTDGIDEEFRSLPVTFGEAMQQVENAAIITFGAFDRGGEFSKAIANFVINGTGGFAEMERAAEEFGISVRSEFDGIASAIQSLIADAQSEFETLRSAFDPMLGGAFNAFDQIDQRAKSSAEYIRSALQLLDDLRNAPADAVNMLGNQTGLNRIRGGRRVLGTGEFAPRRSRLAAGFSEANERRQLQLQGEAQQRRAGAALGVSNFQRYLNDPTKYDLLGNPIKPAGRRTTTPTAAGGKAKGGGRGKSAEQLEKQAERDRQRAIKDQYDLDRQQIDEQRDMVAAQRALSKDYVERAGLAVEMIDLDEKAKKRQIEMDVSLGQISAAEGERRTKLVEQLAILDRQLEWQDTEEQRQREIERLTDVEFGLQRDKLDREARLSETAAERREVELRILDLVYEQERQAIARLRAGSVEDQQQADLRERALNGAYSGDRAAIMQQTRGPWEQFLTSLPTTAAKANEALELVAANGMADLVDGLADAMSGARSLGDVFSQVSKRIVADLIRIQLQKAIVGGLQGVLGGIFGGGIPSTAAVGQMNAGAYAAFSGSLPRLAGGGTIDVRGKGGLDTNLLSINGRPVAMVNKGERIRVDPNSPGRGGAGGGGGIAQIVPSPYFDVVVDGRVVQTGGPMVSSGIRQNNQAQAFRSTRRVA